MQRLPPVLKTCALGAVLALATTARAGDLVFHLTAHGNVTAGVNRLSGVPRGHCLQCHPERQTPVLSSPVLFTVNNNTLCFTCHAATGAGQFYAGQTAYASSSHATSANMYWPGPTPVARPATDAGKCLNCHTPHGARDAQGLISNLERFREEAACLGCHDATGPASTNISAELAKRAAHPVATVTGVHLVGESAATAFGTGKRHAECVDCHNPHAGTAAGPLTGTSQVRVTNGVAGAVTADAARAGRVGSVAGFPKRGCAPWPTGSAVRVGRRSSSRDSCRARGFPSISAPASWARASRASRSGPSWPCWRGRRWWSASRRCSEAPSPASHATTSAPAPA